MMQERKSLPHEIPWWVSQGARHFITINALERNTQPLTAMARGVARSESVALPRSDGACEAVHEHTARSENVALPRSGWTCEAGRATFSERAALDGRAGLSEHAAEDSVARPIAQALLDSLLFYETLGKWYLWTAVVMPDHIHFIATFNLQKGVETTIMAWKRYQTTTLGVAFQRDYFEHRLRNEDEVVEKAEYIRNNPVLRGLADSPEAWPYYWHRNGK